MEEGWEDDAPKRKKTETAPPHLTQIYLPSNLKREVCEGAFTDITTCTVLRLTVSYFKMKENKRTFNLETKYSFPTVPSVQDYHIAPRQAAMNTNISSQLFTKFMPLWQLQGISSGFQ